MNNNDLLNLLDNIQEYGDDSPEGERIMLIDGLNLFYRNFPMSGVINKDGAHIGGLGGFLRSLGSLINLINPTQIYMVFDGMGSTVNRKNIIPGYKSGRHIKRITNWDAFDSLKDEVEAQVSQLSRIVQYLNTVPIKTMCLDRAEADDVIAYMSQVLSKNKSTKIFMVTNDEDYLQLVRDNVILYYPGRKKYYTPVEIEMEYGLSPENFIFYKALIGDNSDSLPGVKGLGPGKLFKLFPELKDPNVVLTLKDIISLSESRLGEHVIYARLLHGVQELKDRYRVMDLGKPMISKSDEKEIKELIKSKPPNHNPSIFVRLHKEDGLHPFISNPELWLRERFSHLK